MATAPNNVTSLKPPSTLSGAMALAFGEIEGAIKKNENAAFKQGGKVSKYADIGAVIDAIKPALISHDLFFTQRPMPSENGVTIATFLHHANGETMELGVLFVPANKQDAQGFGSALTYARRYALVTAFGVPVEDDDGNAASRHAMPSVALIDDAQWASLVQLIEASNTDTKAFCKAYRIDSLKALPSAAYADASGKLNRKLSAKGTAND